MAVQSAKGTPAATPTVKLFMSGSPTLGVTKDRARLAMTDNSRDAGAAYTSQMRVEGDVPVYCHPDAMAFIWYAALGANADGGTMPDYTHTATPASDTPWLTLWRMVAGDLVERFDDCKMAGFSMEGSAGSPLTATMSFVGCDATWLAGTDTVLAALTSSPYLFMDGEGLIEIAGSARKVHRVTLGVNNNHSGYQSDGYSFDDVDPGGREFDFSFATRFGGPSAFPDYKTFIYASGTTLDPTVTPVAVDVTWRKNANLETNVQFPAVTYQPFNVQPDPGGDPLEVEVACFVERGSPTCTVVTADAKATATT